MTTDTPAELTDIAEQVAELREAAEAVRDYKPTSTIGGFDALYVEYMSHADAVTIIALLDGYEARGVEVERLKSDIAQYEIDLGQAQERVAAEFEGDCSATLHDLLMTTGGEDVINHPDGWNGDTAAQHLHDALAGIEASGKEVERLTNTMKLHAGDIISARGDADREHQRAEVAEAALRKSEERTAELEKALEPFGKAAEHAETDEPETNTLWSSSARHQLVLADLFRARAALTKEPANVL